MEVAKLLPLLTAASPDQPSFHVVAFSLPGFGFSEAPKKKGFAVAQYAEVSIFLLAICAYTDPEIRLDISSCLLLDTTNMVGHHSAGCIMSYSHQTF